MTSEGSTSRPSPAPEMAASDQLSVNLNVISPSTAVGTGSPLSFPNLLASTTIGQLKEKIRNLLPTKPTDAQQRLIYKGRVLQQDDETLCQIMGENTVRTYHELWLPFLQRRALTRFLGH